MPRRFATDIDLLSFKLLHAMLDPISSDPSGSLGVGDAGRVWCRTDTSPPSLWFWTGTTAIDLKARASGTGTQTSSTISDLAATVQAYSLSQFAAPTADLSLASHKLINVTDPSNPQDASTKNYVDTQLSGLASGQVLKGAVVCAPTTNVSLTTPGATIDGVALTNPSTILLTGQTTASQNGPYVWTGASIALTRATNWATSAQAVLGSYWVVEQGANADTFALLTNDATVTLGTTALTFTFRGAAGATYTGSSSISVSGTVISAITGAGLIGDSTHAIAPDFSVVGRKVTGTIPAVTGGIFSVSGSVVTINHALSNTAPLLVVRGGSVPVAGYTTGQLVEMDNSATDANNLSLTLPAAPVANNWVITVIG